MIPLQINYNQKQGLKLLFFGAHCDDIEIGCGGAIIKLLNEYKIDEIKWVVFASNKQRKKEAIAGAEIFLKHVEQKEIVVLNYRDAFLMESFIEIKEYFESVKTRFNPDITFTHYRDDRHQDHRLVSDLTYNTFRNHLILEYEIPKYDGDLGRPNLFFKLTEDQAKEKVKYIIDSYSSQAGKHWFDEETFLSLMRIRGLESANIDKYSEAFYSRKAIM